MNEVQQKIIDDANEALVLDWQPLSAKERAKIQKAFIRLIEAYKEVLEEAENIPNLCFIDCKPGDLCPTICPKYKYEE